MKISIFSAFHPFRGGISQFNSALFKELSKNNDVHAFTFNKQYPNFLFPGKTQFVAAEEKDEIGAERIVSTFNPFTYFSASKKINKSQPEIFITNYWMTFFGIFMAVFAKRLPKSVKKVAIIHNLIPHEPRFFDKVFSRYFLKQYDGFIVMSDSVKRELLELRPEAKYLRIDHPWYDHFGEKKSKQIVQNELGLDPTKKTLLFFGLIRDYKGLDVLLDAFELLDDSFQLLIVGEVYSKKEYYQERIAQLKVTKSIIFVDEFIPDAEVTTYFSASDLCVLPYRSATQSGITATSFHFEVPMVVTDVGGLSQIVKDDFMGIVAHSCEAQEIKEAILKCFENDNLTRFKHNIALEKAKNTWENFSFELLNFSEKL